MVDYKSVYSKTPKCQHISVSSTPISNTSNANQSILHNSATLVAHATHSIDLLCKCIALRGHHYCTQHIAQHPEDYALYQAEQAQRNAINKTTNGNTISEDIHTLQALLTKLCNKRGAYEENNMLRIIALLRKYIDKLDTTRKAQRNTMTPDKCDTLAQRITDVISAYIPDKRIEIGAKLKSIAQEYSEGGQSE